MSQTDHDLTQTPPWARKLSRLLARRRFADAMRYLDRNRDGSLSRDELTRSRSLGDGFRSDANKDDKLSPDEVAQHYAHQRGGGDSDGGRSRGQNAGPSDAGGR